MFRQPAVKLMSPLSTLSHSSRLRFFSSKGPDPLCAHHKELVPPFSEVCKLKGFELKSDCTTFHMLSTGYNKCCCPPPCLPPCPKPCCPQDKPCPEKKRSPCD